jgi:hypothetical protein
VIFAVATRYQNVVAMLQFAEASKKSIAMSGDHRITWLSRPSGFLQMSGGQEKRSPIGSVEDGSLQTNLRN